MGVGEEALGAHLASEGWSLKPGVLAHFGQLEDLASARRALLDADLSRVGAPIALAGDARLAGPVVLQVVAVTDVSRPSRETRDPAGTAEWPSGKGRTSGADGDARRLSSASSPPRMLRVELTDGDRALVGVEHETMRAVADEASIPPGSKVLVPANAVLRQVAGILLLRGDESLVPLGGRVAALVRDWERARALRGRADAAKDTARDAPAYRPYDPRDAAATEAAAEKRRAEAKRAADEAAAGTAAAAAAAAAAEANVRETADSEAGFVPRRRPALPPTRAQRAAAAASGAVLPKPGEPIPASPPSAEVRKASDAEETKPGVAARARPALPPRRREAPPGALPPPATTDADARRRERLLSRLVEPSGPREAGGGERGEGRGGGGRGRGGRGRGGRGDKRGGRGRGRGDDDDDDDGLVTFEQHVSRRGRGDDDASEALARRLHRELNVDAARDASSDLAASLFAFSRPVADDGGRGGGGDRGDRGGRGGRGRR